VLRIYFLHHRELLGALSLAAYQTVKELMAAAVEEGGWTCRPLIRPQAFARPSRHLQGSLSSLHRNAAAVSSHSLVKKKVS